MSELNAKASISLIEEWFSNKRKDVHKEEYAQPLSIATLKLLCQWKEQKKIPPKKDKVFCMWMHVLHLDSRAIVF